MRIGDLSEDLVPSFSLIDPFLVVIDASIVILSQEQHVSVVFDLLKCLGAVLVVGDDCSFVRCKAVGVGPEQIEDGAVLERDFSDC